MNKVFLFLMILVATPVFATETVEITCRATRKPEGLPAKIEIVKNEVNGSVTYQASEVWYVPAINRNYFDIAKTIESNGDTTWSTDGFSFFITQKELDSTEPKKYGQLTIERPSNGAVDTFEMGCN